MRWRNKVSLVGATVLAVTVGFCGGCKKSEPEQVTTTSEVSTPSAPPQPQPSPNQPVGQPQATLAQPDGQPDLAELNRTLIRWIVAHKRAPASFEDFAATSGVQIPPPPAGKKYIIAKDMHIQLVSR